jgi:hypothetical protein
MRPIRELARTELVWVQLRGLTFELRSSEDIAATLYWKGSSSAIGETAEQIWTFYRKGVLRQSVTVRAQGSDENVATFRNRWKGGGTLELGRGRQLQLGRKGFWSGQWAWSDELKRPLVHFKNRGLLAMDCQVEVYPEAATSSDLPLLVVLGFYLRTLRFLDASAGAGA